MFTCEFINTELFYERIFIIIINHLGVGLRLLQFSVTEKNFYKDIFILNLFHMVELMEPQLHFSVTVELGVWRFP